ncbi:ABC transporter substrate-binding protein [Clostridium algidicarnis]|uniref:ABC transporter substrate-binding protein n=1 Tax=Clostridium algidicarnis TaxID=37659 RepID=UPI001C0AC707|nr:extracellular solute-binding protein [Clostridium algidicarnis]MBU3196132.1 extracellular solute-binding protein [Clostridium algidicarnis]MBU3209174.1 extracellular solute-binding protein [Clostridium algidicarnis]MBU3229146.1 extracellular solute-binding protein [Clostridium algidicarnis]MBU3252660.1 extracellular solute-binding protein [Clostridium algidicarnis]
MKRNNIYIISIILLLISLSGCALNKKEKNNNDKDNNDINIYVDTKDEGSIDMIQFAIDSYKNQKEGTTVNIKAPVNKKDINTYLKDTKEIDLVITNRNNILELSKQGLIADLNEFYKKNDINSRFYNIITSYGIKGDKYFALGLLPFTIQIIYNEKYFEDKGIEINNVALEELIKLTNDKNVKVPIIAPESIDALEIISVLLEDNLVDKKQLENIYEGNVEKYNNFKDIQTVLDELNKLTKEGYLTKDMLEVKDKDVLNYIDKGRYPMAIVASSYNNNEERLNTKVLGNYKLIGKKKTPVVFMDALIAVANNCKDQEAVIEFMKFIYSDEFQMKISEKGFVTGNIKAMEDNNLINSNLKSDIISSNMSNIPYIYSLPPKIRNEVKSEIYNILRGNYSGNEWEEITRDSY